MVTASLHREKDANGKPVRYYETVHCHRKSDAQIKLSTLLVSKEKGIPMISSHVTVAEYIRSWLESYAKSKASHTYEAYTNIGENHLIPALGHFQLKQLKPEIISRYYANTCQKLSPEPSISIIEC